MSPTRVWIDDSCIACGCCPQAVPAVFSLPEGRALVVGAVREDGATSANDGERAALNTDGIALLEEIREAAAGCPVDAIRVECAEAAR